MRVISISACSVVLMGALACIFSASAAPMISCEELGKPGVITGATVRSATLFAADQKGLPAHCQVSALIIPEPGSLIGVVYRLPTDWNGKLAGLGGGGWQGDIGIGGFSGLAPVLLRGYATAQTDGGHPVGTGFATDWMNLPSGEPNFPAIVDFGHRAIHLMTVVGKEVVAKYYGRAQDYAYFQGCSTGGRQGLMEAQRYPDDYDGIVSGAPVYDLFTPISALVRVLNFGPEERRVSEAQISLAHDRVLEACDASDGSKDGVVTDPRKCDWDPGAMQCTAGQDPATCLTAAQADALRAAYAGIKTSDGQYAGDPLMRGSEPAWARFGALPLPGQPLLADGGILSGLRASMLGDPNFDYTKFDPDRDVPRAMTSLLAREYNANDPDLSAFFASGGKLLMWHGFNDTGPSAVRTAAYFDAVAAANPDGFGNHARFFLAPGVNHCGGGSGPFIADWIGALEQWVEDAKPPEILATRPDGKLAWELCPYPALPYYRGQGALNDPGSYACK